MLFIDYDNLERPQKSAGILDVVTKALLHLPKGAVAHRGACDVRIYGGWYEGSQITRLAQDIAVEIQRDFPKILRLSGPIDTHISIRAELAVSLIQEPGHHLFNTYRRKGKPANIRVEQPVTVGCLDSTCLLPQMKELLKRDRCPKAGCQISQQSLVYRHEQKIVDTMLACDLIHTGNDLAGLVMLISGDDDFLPPIRTACLKGATVIRFHPKPNCPRANFPLGGTKLVELDL